ncbi:MAG TPA: histidinol-phosphate transaminase [Flavobacterium sp.]|nr:histidinol-phosphate transaminase [Flavobacterium sp.]
MNFNINNLVRENVKSMKPYSSARDEFEDFDTADMIFLDANENPFQNGVNRYPDPQQSNVKKTLSTLKNINANQILLGNGSDEVLDLIFRAFCEPKMDNVITLPPTYGMYGVLANINAVENREVLLSNDFQPQVEKILETVDENTKIIFLCSPNNPTANSFSTESVVKLLENFKGLIVIDEAYIDFSDKESWLAKIDEYPNLVITQTLSKAYGLAGIRLGICYASAAIISVLNKIKPPYNVNELTQVRALERLSNPEKIKFEITSIIAQREQLLKVLVDVKFVNKIYPTEANFILIKVDDANKRYDELIAKGIVIRNRTTQPLCENTLRLTIGTEQENKKLIESLTLLGFKTLTGLNSKIK